MSARWIHHRGRRRKRSTDRSSSSSPGSPATLGLCPPSSPTTPVTPAIEITIMSMSSTSTPSPFTRIPGRRLSSGRGAGGSVTRGTEGDLPGIRALMASTRWTTMALPLRTSLRVLADSTLISGGKTRQISIWLKQCFLWSSL